MTIQECERRERIYKKLLEKFLPTFTFDSKDCTPEELECIKVALLRIAWAAMPKHKPCYGKCPRCVWRWNGGCSEWQG